MASQEKRDAEGAAKMVSLFFAPRKGKRGTYEFHERLTERIDIGGVSTERPVIGELEAIFALAVKRKIFTLTEDKKIIWESGSKVLSKTVRKKIATWILKYFNVGVTGFPNLYAFFVHVRDFETERRTAIEARKEAKRKTRSEQSEKIGTRTAVAVGEAKEAGEALDAELVAVAQEAPEVEQKLQEARETLKDVVHELIKEEQIVDPSPGQLALIQESQVVQQQLVVAQREQQQLVAAVSPPVVTPAEEQKQEAVAAAPSLPLAMATDTPIPEERDFPEQVAADVVEEKQEEKAVEPQEAVVAAEIAVEEAKKESKAPEIDQVEILIPEELPASLTAGITSSETRLEGLRRINQLLKDLLVVVNRADSSEKKEEENRLMSEIETFGVIEVEATDGPAEKSEIKKIEGKLTGVRSQLLQAREATRSAVASRKLAADIGSMRASVRASLADVDPIIQRLIAVRAELNGGRLLSDGLTRDFQLLAPASPNSADVVAAARSLAETISGSSVGGFLSTTNDSMALLLSVVSVETLNAIWSIIANDPSSFTMTTIVTQVFKVLIGRIVWGVEYDSNRQEHEAALVEFLERGTPLELGDDQRSSLMNFLLFIIPRPEAVSDADYAAALQIIKRVNLAGESVRDLYRNANISERVYNVIGRIYQEIGVNLRPREAGAAGEFRIAIREEKQREPAITSQEQLEPGLPVGIRFPFEREGRSRENGGIRFEDVEADAIPEELKQEEKVAGLGIADGIRAAIASGAVVVGSGVGVLTKGVQGVVDAVPINNIAANIRADNIAAGGGGAGLAARAANAARAIVAASGTTNAIIASILLAYIVYKLIPTSDAPPDAPTDQEVKEARKILDFGQAGSTTEFFKSEEIPVSPEETQTAQIGPSESWLRPEFDKMGIDVLNAQFAITPLDFEDREWSDFGYVPPIDTQNGIEIDNLFNEFLRFSGDLFKPRYQRATPAPTQSSLNMMASKFTDQYQLSQAFASKFDGILTPYDRMSETFNHSVFPSDWDRNVLYNDNMIAR